MTIDVTIETRNTQHAIRPFGLAIVSGVELLLRKLRDQQSQTFKLFRIQNAIEQLVEVVDRDQLSFGNVAEILARGQKQRRRKLGQEMIGQIEIHVETFDTRQQFDLSLRKHHAADGMTHVRQWQIRKHVLRS